MNCRVPELETLCFRTDIRGFIAAASQDCQDDDSESVAATSIMSALLGGQVYKREFLTLQVFIVQTGR